MSGELRLLNRQRVRRIDLQLLRRLVAHLLADLLEAGDFDFTINLINARENNEFSTYLGYQLTF